MTVPEDLRAQFKRAIDEHFDSLLRGIDARLGSITIGGITEDDIKQARVRLEAGYRA